MGRTGGYSVIEIMIATAISGLVALAAFSVLLGGTLSYEASIHKVEARKVISGATDALTRIFSYTQNLQDIGNTPVTPIIGLAGNGQLRTGTWASLAVTGANVLIPIANFRRDTGVGGKTAATGFSSMMQTGVFYLTPSATTSGVLFINLGTQTPMVANYGSLFFDRITELSITQQQTLPGAILKSFLITITVRIFLKGERRFWRWCPQIDITNNLAGCIPPAPNGIAPYKDYKADIRITIPNQIMRSGTLENLSIPERMLGPLYLFPLLK